MTVEMLRFLIIAAVAGLIACEPPQGATTKVALAPSEKPAPEIAVNTDWQDEQLPFGLRLAAAAEERAKHAVVYDAAYVRISYPMGDVAADKGVCADEIVRAYRLLGIDLQQLVHEDMKRNFALYPKRWGLVKPDTNIDHRRVPNLARFFERHGASLTPSDKGRDYKPGDVVAWALADGRPHIGLVTERRSGDGERPLVLHNIGFGPQIEDMLFELKITGHYRFKGKS